MAEIEELKKQIQAMKCCGNCIHSHWINMPCFTCRIGKKEECLISGTFKYWKFGYEEPDILGRGLRKP